MGQKETMLSIAEEMGLPSIFLEILAMRADIEQRELEYEFDALSFYQNFVGLVGARDIPNGNAALGAALRSAIGVTNDLGGGGAAGYLAVLDVLMVAFREDYRYADDLVSRYVLRRAPGESRK